jgi:sugar lactone lactonase YvrE
MSAWLRCFGVLAAACFLAVSSGEAAGKIPTFKSETKPVVRVKAERNELTRNQQEEFEKLLAEGKRLYLEEMDNEAALKTFLQAEDLAQTREQKAEVFFYLSLIHYAGSRTMGSGEFDRTVRRLIELDYYRALDRLLCPPRYLELFTEIKKEYGVLHVQSSPPGAEVYVDGSGDVFGLTPVDIGHKAGSVSLRLKKGKAEKSDTLRVSAGAEASSPVYRLKKRSPFLAIVGGVTLAGGVSALLFFKKKEPVVPKGTIQVNSTPTGAEVFLDAQSTGKITNCTLTDVEVGSHTIEVAKEGYKNEQSTVVVQEGQTATVSVDLIKHTLRVTEPTAEKIWVMGEEVEIKWETGEESSSALDRDSTFGLNSVAPSKREDSRFRMGRGIPNREALDAGNLGGRKGRTFGVSAADSADKAESQPALSQRTSVNPFDPRRQQASSLHRGVDSAAGRAIGQDSTRSHLSTSGDVRPQALTNVKIQLYKGSDLIATIVNAAENSGLYTWTVTTSLQEGTDYRIKVSCADEQSVSDESESFMITPGYKFLTKWGSPGEADGSFMEPWGITVSGYVYVSDAGNARIQKFNTDGTFVAKWGSLGSANGQFKQPYGIGADREGNIYVVDSANQRIQKFTSQGIHQSTWGEQGSEDGSFEWPFDIALDSSGDCYVLEQFNHRVQKFSAEGTFIKKWGGMGTEDGRFWYPKGIAVSQDGFVYVVDSDNNRIQKFTIDGIFVTKWGTLGTADGNFTQPRRIAIDNSGYVYVTDTYNYRIQKFTVDGKFIMKWGKEGDGDGDFREPCGIVVDESGNVYVCDSGNHRIQKFGPNNK